MSGAAFKGGLYPIWLSYEGEAADDYLIDLYDFSVALRGFERGLALTSHFALNNQVITQATALRGAKILASPPEAGSYKIPAYLATASIAAYSLGSLDQENPLGHLIFSLYELVIYEATGQELDYDHSLRQIYNRALEQGTEGLLMPSRSQFNSLVEKVEPSIAEVHRPITGAGTASSATIFDPVRADDSIKQLELSQETHQLLKYRRRSTSLQALVGRVSSFNMNTFNGRFVTDAEVRPVPFYLTPGGRTEKGIALIAESISQNMKERDSNSARIIFESFVDQTKTGRVARLVVGGVREFNEDEPLIEDY